MITLDIKEQNSTSTSPLSLKTKDEQPTLSFASLLNAVKNFKPSKESGSIQDGVLALSIQNSETPKADETNKSSTKADILSLLKNVETKSANVSDDVVAINPKITAQMTPQELKVVIHKAKQYIKSQIMQSDAFKREELVSLPKTLKGLVQVAKKIGIDISKITLEKVQGNAPLESKSQTQESVKTIDIKTVTQNDETEVKQNTKNSDLPDEIDTLAKTKKSVAVKNVPETTHTKIKKDVKTALPTETVQTKIETKETIHKSDINHIAHNTKRSVQETSEEVNFVQNGQKREIKTPLPKETPLFKAQSKTEITTQEIVNAKIVNIEADSKKEKVQNSLEALLRGEKASNKANANSVLTADFSVATAKVIAPGITAQSPKYIESLLHEGEESGTVESKSEGISSLKADSFEVKLNEAKQMIRYLSHDVKNAIEDYKSPFTRVKVQLNPKQLGEVDLTVVQRGKNLHINLSSNNAAINTLAMNANDLKGQLNNNGINNATLNFSNTPQNGENSSGSQTQQQHQQREHSQSEYNYFESEESKEELMSSLEIVVPHYA